MTCEQGWLIEIGQVWNGTSELAGKHGVWSKQSSVLPDRKPNVF
jgi:hypothetical protein